MASPGPVAKIRLLRPIRVLVVSRDPRYLSVVAFLLQRESMVLESSRKPRALLQLVGRGVDVVVLDASDSLAVAADALAELQALHPSVGVIVVAERPARRGAIRPLPKWGPPHRLVEEIERAYLRLNAPRSAEPGETASGQGSSRRAPLVARRKRRTGPRQGS
jgi:DNA-binding NtrC family response regulator